MESSERGEIYESCTAFFYENWKENFLFAPTKMTEFLKLYGFKKKD